MQRTAVAGTRRVPSAVAHYVRGGRHTACACYVGKHADGYVAKKTADPVAGTLPTDPVSLVERSAVCGIALRQIFPAITPLPMEAEMIVALYPSPHQLRRNRCCRVAEPS
jgi:hypothetical protein